MPLIDLIAYLSLGKPVLIWAFSRRHHHTIVITKIVVDLGCPLIYVKYGRCSPKLSPSRNLLTDSVVSLEWSQWLFISFEGFLPDQRKEFDDRRNHRLQNL